MSFSGPAFIVAIVALSMGAWMFTTWIRARHGYPVENEWGGTVVPHDPELKRQNELLARENEALTAKLSRMEERIAVLERIATDKSARLAGEIDSLR